MGESAGRHREGRRVHRADDGDWTVITRDDGSKQWAYKGKPLYTYRVDAPGKPASGVGPAWPLAVK